MNNGRPSFSTMEYTVGNTLPLVQKALATLRRVRDNERKQCIEQYMTRPWLSRLIFGNRSWSQARDYVIKHSLDHSYKLFVADERELVYLLDMCRLAQGTFAGGSGITATMHKLTLSAQAVSALTLWLDDRIWDTRK